MADTSDIVSYEDLAAIEDEFHDIDTEICKAAPETRFTMLYNSTRRILKRS